MSDFQSGGKGFGFTIFLNLAALSSLGTTWFPIKLGLADLPPLTFMAARFLLASIVSFLLLLFGPVRLPKDIPSHRIFFQIGLFFFVIPYLLVYWGIQYIASGLAAILFALSPMYTAVMAHFILPEEPLSSKRVVGIFTGFVGLMVIFRHSLGAGDPREFLGALAVGLAPAFSSYAGILSKQQVKKYGTRILTGFSIGYGTLVIATLAIFLERGLPMRFSTTVIWSTLFLSIFGTVITSLALIRLYQHFGVTQMAMVTYVTPIIAVVMGYLFLGEVLPPQLWVGSGFVFSGIVLVGGTRRGV